MTPPKDLDRKRPGQEDGFTLLELLVCIAVIGILASIMLSSLGRAGESAKRTACLNNLHQHGIAFRLFLADQNEKFPAYDTWYGLGGVVSSATDNMLAGKLIKRPLNDYVGNVNAFRCPSDRGGKGLAPLPGSDKNVFIACGNSYLAAYGYDIYGVQHVTGARAGAVGQPPSGAGPLPPIKANSIDLRPSNKLIEGEWRWMDSLAASAVTSWHGDFEMFPMLLGDGHVANFRLGHSASRAFATLPDPNSDWW